MGEVGKVGVKKFKIEKAETETSSFWLRPFCYLSSQPLPGGVERLGKNARLAEHGHEVVVAVPTRHDVRVEMRNAPTGAGTDVEADIETVRLERVAQELLGGNDNFHQVSAPGGVELLQFDHFTERNGEEVAGVVRIAVEQQIAPRRTMDDEGGAVVTQCGQLGERLLRGRVARRLDVVHPPVRVELLHGQRLASKVGWTGKVKAGVSGFCVKKCGEGGQASHCRRHV